MDHAQHYIECMNKAGYDTSDLYGDFNYRQICDS